MAFQEEYRDYFFGRERLIERLVTGVQQQPLVAVIGASGSGKSSLVFAGLIPRLRDEGGWLIESFRPQHQPLFRLAAVLVRWLMPELDEIQQLGKAADLLAHLNQQLTVPQVLGTILHRYRDKRLLLVVDQFEELYTLCPDKGKQQQFVDGLLAAVESAPRQLRVVLTLRADFFSYVLNYPPFGEALQAYPPQLLRGMNSQEMQAAIVCPAQKVGVELEDGLTERILQDVQQEPGNLPLLEFALTQLWQKQQQGRLTHQAYGEIGGVAKALANHAEAVYAGLCLEERKQVERIIVQLVRPGEGTEDTRRLATREEVGNWQVVKQLADARLVVTGWDEQRKVETVEVVHEALIQEWGRLREWMEKERDFRIWQEGLRALMRQWKATGKDNGALLRGKPLAEAENWLQQREGDLLGERAYIRASLVRQQEEIEEQEYQKQQLELAQVGQIDALSRYANELFHQHKEFDALIESLRAGISLKRLSRVRNDIRMRVVAALREAVYGVRERNRLEGHSDRVISVSFNPDGKTLASGSCDETIKIWDISTGQEITTLKGHKDSIISVSFSPNGKILASGSDDKTIKIWDIATGQEITTLKGHKDSIISVSFSPNGKILASSSGDNTIKLWDIVTGRTITTLKGHSNRVNSVSFSPDGKTIASGSGDDTIKLWDIATGKEINTLKGRSYSVTSVSFSPDGKTIASGSGDDTIKLWDIATGKEVTVLNGHSSRVTSVSFSPDGKTIASGSWDKTIKLWDIPTGKENTIFTGHRDSIESISFSPDGKTIASGSCDNTIKIWDIATGEEITTLTGHSYWVTSVSFSPDGKTIASGSDDDTIKLWNITTGEQITTLTGHNHTVISLSFSPDGKTLSSGGWDNTIKLWNIETLQEISTIDEHRHSVNSISFSPNGKTIASSGLDNIIKLWDIATGVEITTLKGHSNWFTSISFSPDGKTIAFCSDDNSIKLWDISTGTVKATLKGHSYRINSISFSPNSKTIASGSDDYTIKLWDIPTGNEVTVLKGHSFGVTSVSFSPDSKTIASGSRDYTIKLWDISTGKEITTLKGHTELVNSVSFSPDGKTLASGSWDNTIILWNLDLDDLLVRGCNWVCPYLQHNPNVSESDRHLCDGISTGD